MNRMMIDPEDSRISDTRDVQRSFAVHESIPLNREIAHDLDVEHIVHFPDTGTILVQLQRNRTCVEPQLIGRLSGIHLSKVKWSYEELKRDLIIGHYSVPSPGPYFIEIIVTMCQRLDANADAKMHA
jgi:hypothetical protein